MGSRYSEMSLEIVLTKFFMRHSNSSLVANGFQAGFVCRVVPSNGPSKLRFYRFGSLPEAKFVLVLCSIRVSILWKEHSECVERFEGGLALTGHGG